MVLLTLQCKSGLCKISLVILVVFVGLSKEGPERAVNNYFNCLKRFNNNNSIRIEELSDDVEGSQVLRAATLNQEESKVEKEFPAPNSDEHVVLNKRKNQPSLEKGKISPKETFSGSRKVTEREKEWLRYELQNRRARHKFLKEWIRRLPIPSGSCSAEEYDADERKDDSIASRSLCIYKCSEPTKPENVGNTNGRSLDDSKCKQSGQSYGNTLRDRRIFVPVSDRDSRHDESFNSDELYGLPEINIICYENIQKTDVNIRLNNRHKKNQPLIGSESRFKTVQPSKSSRSNDPLLEGSAKVCLENNNLNSLPCDGNVCNKNSQEAHLIYETHVTENPSLVAGESKCLKELPLKPERSNPLADEENSKLYLGEVFDIQRVVPWSEFKEFLIEKKPKKPSGLPKSNRKNMLMRFERFASSCVGDQSYKDSDNARLLCIQNAKFPINSVCPKSTGVSESSNLLNSQNINDNSSKEYSCNNDFSVPVNPLKSLKSSENASAKSDDNSVSDKSKKENISAPLKNIHCDSNVNEENKKDSVNTCTSPPYDFDSDSTDSSSSYFDRKKLHRRNKNESELESMSDDKVEKCSSEAEEYKKYVYDDEFIIYGWRVSYRTMGNIVRFLIVLNLLGLFFVVCCLMYKSLRSIFELAVFPYEPYIFNSW